MRFRVWDSAFKAALGPMNFGAFRGAESSLLPDSALQVPPPARNPKLSDIPPEAQPETAKKSEAEVLHRTKGRLFSGVA